MTGAMKGSTRNAQLQVLLAYENVPLNLAIHELRLKYPKNARKTCNIRFAIRCSYLPRWPSAESPDSGHRVI